MEWAEILKQGGLAALAGLAVYFFVTERIARDKERETAATRYDALLAILLKHMPDSIKADLENVAALRSVETAQQGVKSVLEILARKAGA